MSGFPVLIAKDTAVSYIGILLTNTSSAGRIAISMSNGRFVWTADSSDGETKIVNSTSILAKMVCRERRIATAQTYDSVDGSRLTTGVYTLLTTIVLDADIVYEDVDVLIYP